MSHKGSGAATRARGGNPRIAVSAKEMQALALLLRPHDKDGPWLAPVSHETWQAILRKGWAVDGVEDRGGIAAGRAILDAGRQAFFSSPQYGKAAHDVIASHSDAGTYQELEERHRAEIIRVLAGDQYSPSERRRRQRSGRGRNPVEEGAPPVGRFETWASGARRGAKGTLEGAFETFGAAKRYAEVLARDLGEETRVVDRYLEAEDSVVWRSGGPRGHHRHNPVHTGGGCELPDGPCDDTYEEDTGGPRTTITVRGSTPAQHFRLGNPIDSFIVGSDPLGNEYMVGSYRPLYSEDTSWVVTRISPDGHVTAVTDRKGKHVAYAIKGDAELLAKHLVKGRTEPDARALVVAHQAKRAAAKHGKVLGGHLARFGAAAAKHGKAAAIKAAAKIKEAHAKRKGNPHGDDEEIHEVLRPIALELTGKACFTRKCFEPANLGEPLVLRNESADKIAARDAKTLRKLDDLGVLAEADPKRAGITKHWKDLTRLVEGGLLVARKNRYDLTPDGERALLFSTAPKRNRSRAR
jgi:hypothetical protein